MTKPAPSGRVVVLAFAAAQAVYVAMLTLTLPTLEKLAGGPAGVAGLGGTWNVRVAAGLCWPCRLCGKWLYRRNDFRLSIGHRRIGDGGKYGDRHQVRAHDHNHDRAYTHGDTNCGITLRSPIAALALQRCHRTREQHLAHGIAPHRHRHKTNFMFTDEALARHVAGQRL